MTRLTLDQDVIIYLVLITVVWLYRIQLRRISAPRTASRAVAAWTMWGHLFATYYMMIGVLYQIGMVPRLVAYALFVIGIAVMFYCLRALRRFILGAQQSASDASEGSK